jgi:hypothetical protein
MFIVATNYKRALAFPPLHSQIHHRRTYAIYLLVRPSLELSLTNVLQVPKDLQGIPQRSLQSILPRHRS